ncbi:unnamed protein product [Amoebophrya sp. A120]|nr:unnamed protein product [Amoebophrya sp. A120]|eukprot:GSA120T00016086001.1
MPAATKGNYRPKHAQAPSCGSTSMLTSKPPTGAVVPATATIASSNTSTRTKKEPCQATGLRDRQKLTHHETETIMKPLTTCTGAGTPWTGLRNAINCPPSSTSSSTTERNKPSHHDNYFPGLLFRWRLLAAGSVVLVGYLHQTSFLPVPSEAEDEQPKGASTYFLKRTWDSFFEFSIASSVLASFHSSSGRTRTDEQLPAGRGASTLFPPGESFSGSGFSFFSSFPTSRVEVDATRTSSGGQYYQQTEAPCGTASRFASSGETTYSDGGGRAAWEQMPNGSPSDIGMNTNDHVHATYEDYFYNVKNPYGNHNLQVPSSSSIPARRGVSGGGDDKDYCGDGQQHQLSRQLHGRPRPVQLEGGGGTMRKMEKLKNQEMNHITTNPARREKEAGGHKNKRARHHVDRLPSHARVVEDVVVPRKSGTASTAAPDDDEEEDSASASTDDKNYGSTPASKSYARRSVDSSSEEQERGEGGSSSSADDSEEEESASSESGVSRTPRRRTRAKMKHRINSPSSKHGQPARPERTTPVELGRTIEQEGHGAKKLKQHNDAASDTRKAPLGRKQERAGLQQTAPPASFQMSSVRTLNFARFNKGWKNRKLLRILANHVTTRKPLILRNVGVPEGTRSIAEVLEGIRRAEKAEEEGQKTAQQKAAKDKQGVNKKNPPSGFGVPAKGQAGSGPAVVVQGGPSNGEGPGAGRFHQQTPPAGSAQPRQQTVVTTKYDIAVGPPRSTTTSARSRPPQTKASPYPLPHAREDADVLRADLIRQAQMKRNLVALHAAPRSFFQSRFGRFGTRKRWKTMCNDFRSFGRFEVPVHVSQAFHALNGTASLEDWGPAANQFYCAAWHLGAIETWVDRPVDFVCSMEQMRKLLLPWPPEAGVMGSSTDAAAPVEDFPHMQARPAQGLDVNYATTASSGSTETKGLSTSNGASLIPYQLYLQEDMPERVEDIHPASAPVLPYLHRKILSAPQSPPTELAIDPDIGMHLLFESRHLTGGSAGTVVNAHTDCNAKLLVNYWGRRKMHLFDGLPLIAANEQDDNFRSTSHLSPTSQEGDFLRADLGRKTSEFSSSPGQDLMYSGEAFDTLWKLRRISEDLMLVQEDKENHGRRKTTATTGLSQERGTIFNRESSKDEVTDTENEQEQLAAVRRLRTQFQTHNVTISEVEIGPGDAIFLPEMFFSDATMLEASLGVNMLYQSQRNGAETFCLFLRDFGPKACGGRITSRGAGKAARMGLRANWKKVVADASLWQFVE